MTRFIFALLVLLSSANCFAIGVFDIHFTLELSEQDRAIFPDGFIRGSPWQDTYPWFSKLEIRTRAVPKVLSDTVVRFVFEEPVKVKHKRYREEETEKEYSYVDFEFTPEDMKKFRWLHDFETDYFLVTRGKSPTAPTFDAMLAFADTSPTLEPLASTDMISGLPMLKSFAGEIYLGNVPYFVFDQAQKVPGRLGSCVLHEVVEYDSVHHLIRPNKTYNYNVDDLINGSYLPADSFKVRKFLGVQKKVNEIRWKMWAPLVEASSGMGAVSRSNIVNLNTYRTCNEVLTSKSFWSRFNLRSWLRRK